MSGSEANRLHIITLQNSIREALERLEVLSPVLILFVVNDAGKLEGVLTDGDIRRGLTSGMAINEPVSKVMNRHFKYLDRDNYSVNDIVRLKKEKIFLVPLVDRNMLLTDILNLNIQRSMLPLDAVIMAGGEGLRLRPLTEHLPKPLLPVAGKAIIQYNIDLLKRFGVSRLSVSVNYLGEKIRQYFAEHQPEDMVIQILEESTPLGTLGALTLADGFDADDILLMNSDILTNIDLESFYLHYKNNNADMAVATVPYSVEIPYGVLETEGYTITHLKEKPTYTYYANAGIYLIKKELVENLEKGVRLDATDFIERQIGMGKKVISFPILNYWLDIGKHDDYRKAEIDVKQLVF